MHNRPSHRYTKCNNYEVCALKKNREKKEKEEERGRKGREKKKNIYIYIYIYIYIRNLTGDVKVEDSNPVRLEKQFGSLSPTESPLLNPN